MRTHFDEVLVREKDKVLAMEKLDSLTEIESFLYMSYWYGGLYVVIEGWQRLKLSDDIIDNLLISSNVQLLKRYRNGVFHFQKEYIDKRFEEFMEQGMNAVTWVRSLNEQFGRYFLENS